MGKRWTIKELLNVAADYLLEKGIDSPRLAAEILLAHVLGVKRIDLYLDFERPLSSAEVSHFRGLIKRRLAREPLQYIIGHQEFWSLDFLVNQKVLIPRPETEVLVEQAIKYCRSNTQSPSDQLDVLDLCTGCGAIAISIAKEVPYTRVWATDISEEAISIAKTNAQRHGVMERIEFLVGHLFEPVREKGLQFHLIVTNPPYVAEEEYESLAPEIRDYEPRAALDGGAGGMVLIEEIINTAPDFLTSRGVLMIEMDPRQISRAKELIASVSGYGAVDVIKDYSGLDRIVMVGGL